MLQPRAVRGTQLGHSYETQPTHNVREYIQITNGTYLYTDIYSTHKSGCVRVFIITTVRTHSLATIKHIQVYRYIYDT